MLIQPIVLPAQTGTNVSFYIYRGDMECTTAPGNKQHKLKYHIDAAQKAGAHYVGTFGGPHSNHIAAFVSRCQELNLCPIVVVRGEVWASLTPTLRQAVDQGAILFPSSRDDYRLGVMSQAKQQVECLYPSTFWVPEGGSGLLGFLGCLEWANNIYNEFGRDAHVCVSSGTGTTAAGFVSSRFSQVSIFSALKGASDVASQVIELCNHYHRPAIGDVHGYDECHHGGFGKISPSLIAFLNALRVLNPDIVLDPVYTAKMLYHVNHLLVSGQWPYRETLFIHTGGLQGWQGVKTTKNPYCGER